tara:strand:+ start:42289 stop:43032 length:744 start_codon:yes stop_codon:yes gene_type:complete
MLFEDFLAEKNYSLVKEVSGVQILWHSSYYDGYKSGMCLFENNKRWVEMIEEKQPYDCSPEVAALTKNFLCSLQDNKALTIKPVIQATEEGDVEIYFFGDFGTINVNIFVDEGLFYMAKIDEEKIEKLLPNYNLEENDWLVNELKKYADDQVDMQPILHSLDDISSSEKNWHRRFAIIELTHNQIKEEEYWHQLFSEYVGTHCDYTNGKRNHEGVKPRETHHLYYDKAKKRKKVDLSQNTILAWYET